MKFDLLMGNVVQRLEGRSPGIVVMKFPGGEGAVLSHAAPDLDHPGGAEIGPGKFFLARPDELDRFAGSLG